MDTLDDAELLNLFATEKSEAAFAELVRRHIDAVYHVALRKVGGDRHAAEDVAQTVFVALASKARSLRDRRVLGGWLYRATHLAAAELVRGESRRRKHEAEAQAMNESQSNDRPEQNLGPLKEAIDHTLNELKESDRDVIWLRFFAGLSFAEIGARMRLTENTARMRVERALDKLQGLLARRGITSSAIAVSTLLAEQAAGAAPVGLAASVTGQALAGAAVPGGPAAGLLFMSTTKIAVGSVALALALGWLVIKEHRRAAAPIGPVSLAATPAPIAGGARPVTAQPKRDAAPASVAPAELPAAPAPRLDKNAADNPSAISKTTDGQKSRMLNNLRMLAAARDQYFRVKGHLPANAWDLVGPNGYVREMTTANGEDYDTLDLSSGRLTVMARDGTEVTFEAGPPGSMKGPPTIAETQQYQAELAAYIAARSQGTLPPEGMAAEMPGGKPARQEIGYLAIAEMFKREGWQQADYHINPPQDSEGQRWTVNVSRVLERDPTGGIALWGDHFVISLSPEGKIIDFRKTERLVRVPSN